MRRCLVIIACLTLVSITSFVTITPTAMSRGTTGFWQVVRDDQGVWWFRSPDGRDEFITSVTTIQPFQEGHADSYYSRDFDGDLERWAEKTSHRVRSAGFKASGAWSHPAIFRHLPYSKDLNLFLHCHLPITDPGWEAEVERAIISQVVSLREDSNLIGYYLDNELKWGFTKDGVLHETLLGQNAEKYFEVTTRLVRKHDPNHLILGVRFNHRPPLEVIVAMKGRVDVQSVNCYSNDGGLWRNHLRELYTITECPIIISEFSFWAVENASGNLSTKAWWKGQQTQKERADITHQFILGAADNSFIIETAFFQWSDEPVSGRTSDGEDINCGMVSLADQAYPEMVVAIRDASSRVNMVHSRSNDRQRNLIWRDDPIRVTP